MLKRRVTLTLSDARGHKWEEEFIEGKRGSFQEDEMDLEVWANDLVGEFNAGLRPGELARHIEAFKLDEVEDENPEDDVDEDDVDEDDEDLDEDEEDLLDDDEE